MEEERRQTWWAEVQSSWSSFLSIALRPLIVITLGVALVIAVVSYKEKPQPGAISAILMIINSILCGVIGAIACKYWNDLNEQSILITRGKSAIRGLAVLTQSISALEQRVRAFLDTEDTSEQKLHGELETARYEELLSRFCNLQEQTINAVEEWKDIIPEAAIKTQIGVITQLRAEKVTLEIQLAEIRKELTATMEESMEKSREEIKALQQQLKEKEKNLAKVKSDLLEKSSQFSFSGYPVFYQSSGSTASAAGSTHPSYTYIIEPPPLSPNETEKAEQALILEYLRKKHKPVTLAVIAAELALPTNRTLAMLVELIPRKVYQERDTETGELLYSLLNPIESPHLELSGNSEND